MRIASGELLDCMVSGVGWLGSWELGYCTCIRRARACRLHSMHLLRYAWHLLAVAAAADIVQWGGIGIGHFAQDT